MASEPTRRFSSRVENYVKFRPNYPPAVLDVMREVCGFTPADVVADIGAGTGIFSEALLNNGNEVFAVEPNGPMREAAEHALAGHPGFHSVNGTAETTTLPGRSVDFVTAAQAFHWFDREPTRAEFVRILRPGGWLVLIWNVRRLDSTPFLASYENLLSTYGTDYTDVRDKHPDLPQVQAFVGTQTVTLRTLEHHQWFSYDGLLGRLLSSSYAPEFGHANHSPMLDQLAAIFTAHQVDGKVSFDYNTQIYCAKLTPDRRR